MPPGGTSSPRPGKSLPAARGNALLADSGSAESSAGAGAAAQPAAEAIIESSMARRSLVIGSSQQDGRRPSGAATQLATPSAGYQRGIATRVPRRGERNG